MSSDNYPLYNRSIIKAPPELFPIRNVDDGKHARLGHELLYMLRIPTHDKYPLEIKIAVDFPSGKPASMRTIQSPFTQHNVSKPLLIELDKAVKSYTARSNHFRRRWSRKKTQESRAPEFCPETQQRIYRLTDIKLPPQVMPFIDEYGRHIKMDGMHVYDITVPLQYCDSMDLMIRVSARQEPEKIPSNRAPLFYFHGGPYKYCSKLFLAEIVSALKSNLNRNFDLQQSRKRKSGSSKREVQRSFNF